MKSKVIRVGLEYQIYLRVSLSDMVLLNVRLPEGGRDLLSAPPRSSFQGFGGSISSRGAKDVCRKPENIVRFGIMNKQDEHCSRWRPKLKLLFFRDKGTFN